MQVLSWIDICAGLAAKSVAGGPCVTASVDSVHFLSPCHLGSVCIVAAMVNRTFASSMEVCVLSGYGLLQEQTLSITCHTQSTCLQSSLHCCCSSHINKKGLFLFC